MDDPVLLVLLIVAVVPLLAGVFIGSAIMGALRYIKARKDRQLLQTAEKVANAASLFDSYLAFVTGVTGPSSSTMTAEEATRRAFGLLQALDIANELVANQPYNAPGLCTKAIAEARKALGIIQGGNPLQPNDLNQLWRAQVTAYSVVVTLQKTIIGRQTKLSS